MFVTFLKFILAYVLFASSAFATAKPTYTLYIDADYSISPNAAEAIESGIRAALKEVDNTVAGINLDVRPMNHRANSKRSRKHMQDYLKDSEALVFFGGMHSPPYLTNQSFINESRILALLPWSAAGPITRPKNEVENWIFRLSVDDSKAGHFLVQQAAQTPGCERIGLALVDTGWGRSNKGPMIAALADYNKTLSETVMFDADIGRAGSQGVVEQLAAAGTDCIVMLAINQGPDIVEAVAKQMPGVRIFSHWGITGGNFAELTDVQARQTTNLRILQTCGLRAEIEGNDALTRALENSNGLGGLSQIPAPTGFVHGYDLTRLFLAAADQASTTEGWKGSTKQKRLALRTALENLQTPVAGILKTYQRPFSPFSASNPDAHEALGAEDLCMASFSPDGRIVHGAVDE